MKRKVIFGMALIFSIASAFALIEVKANNLYTINDTFNSMLLSYNNGTILKKNITNLIVDNSLVVGHHEQITLQKKHSFQVLGTDDDDAGMVIGRFSNDGVGGARLNFLKSRSTYIGGHAVANDMDFIGGARWYADDGVNYILTGALIGVVDDDNPEEDDIGGSIRAYFTKDGEGDTLFESFRANADGLSSDILSTETLNATDEWSNIMDFENEFQVVGETPAWWYPASSVWYKVDGGGNATDMTGKCLRINVTGDIVNGNIEYWQVVPNNPEPETSNFTFDMEISSTSTASDIYSHLFLQLIQDQADNQSIPLRCNWYRTTANTVTWVNWLNDDEYTIMSSTLPLDTVNEYKISIEWETNTTRFYANEDLVHTDVLFAWWSDRSQKYELIHFWDLSNAFSINTSIFIDNIDFSDIQDAKTIEVNNSLQFPINDKTCIKDIRYGQPGLLYYDCSQGKMCYTNMTGGVYCLTGTQQLDITANHDLAEYFPTTEKETNYENGQILCQNATMLPQQIISNCTSANSNLVVGVKNNDYSKSINEKKGDYTTPIVRTGWVKTWVNCNLASISAGDLITTSNIAGVGMKQSDNIYRANTVGKSTENCNSGINKIGVLVGQ